MNADGLTEFLAVTRAGSFTAAAKSLGVSVPHVSRQVARLEERLGTKLFHRSTRSVHLTQPGEGLRKSTERIADDLEAALCDASSSQRNLEGSLRIASLSGSFGDQVVGPAMNEMAQLYPNVDITIDFNPRQVDILSEGYDFAIRAGQLQSSGLIARPLANRTRVAFASQSYLENHGAPQHPSDLKHHQCILAQSRSWRFQENDGPMDVAVSGRLTLNSGPAILDACTRGLGIAYMAVGGFDTALINGSLSPILQPYWHTDQAIHVVRPDRRFTPRRVEVAIELLTTFARQAETRDARAIMAFHNEN